MTPKEREKLLNRIKQAEEDKKLAEMVRKAEASDADDERHFAPLEQ